MESSTSVSTKIVRSQLNSESINGMQVYGVNAAKNVTRYALKTPPVKVGSKCVRLNANPSTVCRPKTQNAGYMATSHAIIGSATPLCVILAEVSRATTKEIVMNNMGACVFVRGVGEVHIAKLNRK